jgi:hypothetical protein
MLRYSFLAFAILGSLSVEASAQGVLRAGVYTRSDARGTAKLTVTDVPTGNSVVHIVHTISSLPFPPCVGMREDIIVSFDVPKNYEMNSPITGNGTCIVVQEPPGCNVTCSVPAQTWRFNQTGPRTIVVTDSSGSFTYKRSHGDKPLVNIEVKDVMNTSQRKKKYRKAHSRLYR